MTLLLRSVREADESALFAAQSAMGASFAFAFDLDPTRPFADYVRRLDDHAHGRNLAPGFVPHTYLIAEVAGVLVGRISLRHTLNEALQRVGGHIGFGVLPSDRRKGYATEMLRQTLPRARALGLARVLLTCDDTNVGSRAVIERCRGRLTQTLPAEAGRDAVRHYWIELT